MVVNRTPVVSDEKKKPVKTFRSGQVKGSIWTNDFKLKDGTIRKSHSVSIIRSYKRADSDTWEDTNSYNVDSLADLELVAKSCREYLKLKDN